MIDRYLQNTDVSMTKDTYFEMCEMLNSEPVESEIPVDMEDFPTLVQDTFVIYNLLEDRWDSMAGAYLGKNYSMLFNLYDMYKVPEEEHLLVLRLLQQMDGVRSRLISEKIKQKSPST